MPSIQISGSIISFPDSAQSPDWSQGIIEFAQAVEDALSTVVSPFDIGQRVMSLDGLTGTQVITDSVIPLQFATDPVLTQSGTRAAYVRYAVYRVISAVTYVEQGNISVLFDGSNWSISTDKIGNAKCYFTIDGSGQISIVMDGTTTTGRITYTAQGLKQS